MPSAEPLSWLDEPLARPLLEFNFLPAGLCHPDHAPSGWSALVADVAGLNVDPAALACERNRALRLASGTMLPDLHDEWVAGIDDPALPLFMAPTETFQLLLLHLGLVPLGPSVRQVIARDEVRALETALGSDALGFARRVAGRWWSGAAETMLPLAADPRAQALLLGAAVLFSVACQATLPVAKRARLRLPAAARDAIAHLPAPFREGPLSPDVAFSTLQQLDPQWTALFPVRP